MSCCLNDDQQKDGDIEKKTESLKKKIKSETRLLLLGTGESGKSTIAKQMRIIHMNGFSDDEKAFYISAIHGNIHNVMVSLIEGCEQLDIEIKNSDLVEPWLEPLDLGRLPDHLIKTIEPLWNDEGVQEAFKRRNEFQIIDSAQYFMENLERIVDPDYMPSDQDILRCRIQTTGVTETKFEMDGKAISLVDVGGQRSERKKWIHCFENVTGVLFCTAISTFDQTLFEDNTTNRLLEDLKVFHEICKSKWFSNTAIILFLNKSDIFEEKIKLGKSISTAFKDYKGPTQFEPSVKFIEGKFCNVVDPLTNEQKPVYSHVTTATDTKNVQVVFEAVQDFIFGKALDDLL